ncbi:MAG: hypothetical protein ACPL3A_07460 [Thermoanaerobacteraceae bacterium]
MKKIITYSLVVFSIGLFITIIMLNYKTEEPITADPQINTFSDYMMGNNKFEKAEEIADANQKSDIKDIKLPMEQKYEIKGRDDDENKRKVRIFKEKYIDELLKEKNRQIEEIYKDEIKDNKTQKDKNKILVTPEEILKVQREMDFDKKVKVINIITKIGNDNIEKIMEISKDGITEDKDKQIMDILSKYLTLEEINYLIKIADEYFK